MLDLLLVVELLGDESFDAVDRYTSSPADFESGNNLRGEQTIDGVTTDMEFFTQNLDSEQVRVAHFSHFLLRFKRVHCCTNDLLLSLCCFFCNQICAIEAVRRRITTYINTISPFLKKLPRPYIV